MADWIRRNIDFEDQRQRAVRESEDIEDGAGYGHGGGYDYGLLDGSGYDDSHGPRSDSTTPEDEP